MEPVPHIRPIALQDTIWLSRPSTRQTILRDKGNEIKTHTDMDMEIDVEKIWGGSTSLSHHFVCWWPCFSVLWMHSLVSITPCFICLGYPFFSMRTFHSFFFFYSSYSAASTLHFAGIDSHITLSHAYTDDDIICIFSLFLCQFSLDILD